MSLTFPCIYCTDDLKCTKYTDDEATSFCVLGPCKDEKPSNGDKIRAMSDEELAAWIETIAHCILCPNYYTKQCTGAVFSESCKLHWLEWLKEESDNG